jgi:hypothetical protein
MTNVATLEKPRKRSKPKPKAAPARNGLPPVTPPRSRAWPARRAS